MARPSYSRGPEAVDLDAEIVARPAQARQTGTRRRSAHRAARQERSIDAVWLRAAPAAGNLRPWNVIRCEGGLRVSGCGATRRRYLAARLAEADLPKGEL